MWDLLARGLAPTSALVLLLVVGGFLWSIHHVAWMWLNDTHDRAKVLILGFVQIASAVILGFILVLGMPSAVRPWSAPPASGVTAATLDQLYDAAVRRTALRDPALFVTPAVLDVPTVLPAAPPGTPAPACEAEGGCVAMVAFRLAEWGEKAVATASGPDGLICDPADSAAPRPALVRDGDRVRACRALWLTTEKDLRRFCPRGGGPANLALRQALGLPPGEAPYRIHRLTVSLRDLIRPCIRPTGLAERSCLDPGNPRQSWPTNVARISADGAPDMTAEKRSAFFALVHAWNTTQDGLGRNAYPFTGLGWTYNWNPEAPSIVGVTELVLQETAPFKLTGVAQAPDEFCRAY